MSWLTNFVRPKINALVGNDVPENLWEKCKKCEQMVFKKELNANIRICPHCDNHIQISVQDRIKSLFDNGKFVKIKFETYVKDPIKFKDSKRYTDRLRENKAKSKENEAIIVGHGHIGGHKVVAAFFVFEFMGGSMGSAVGEAFIAAAEYAASHKCAFLAVPCSGGARMQEGPFSLMQMPRTIVAINKIKENKLPYIVLLTNPTTGGVSASFAMLGDIHIAEPGALIAFAGPRVIEGTIKEALPEGFQMSEYLLDHGMIDMVVHRKDLPKTITNILNIIFNKNNHTESNQKTS